MKPKSNHCAECEKRGELCPECAELDAGEDGGIVDGVPMTKFTVTAKRLPKEEVEEVVTVIGKKPKEEASMEDGMGHLKFLREQLAEAKGEAEKKKIRAEISDWSSLLLKRHKPKAEEKEEGEEEEETTSFLDSFNPSRPLGMR